MILNWKTFEEINLESEATNYLFMADKLDREQLNKLLDILDDVVLDCAPVEIVYGGQYGETKYRYTVRFSWGALMDDYDCYLENAEDCLIAALKAVHKVCPLKVSELYGEET